MSDAPPLSMRLYLRASAIAPPLLRLLLRRRAARGKEDATRLAEREGHGAMRPATRHVVWAHGASVGEVTALLGLLEALTRTVGDIGGVVTSGTVTAARVVEGRLPPGFAHRYAPLDCLPWVERFLDGWRPDLALRIDSELWPATLETARRRGIPVVLINGRLSEKSARRWSRLPSFARHLMRALSAIGAQDASSAARFRDMGAAAEAVRVIGSLKAAAPPLAASPEMLADLRARHAGRPIWLAASIHPEEDALVLDAALALSRRLPGLLTVIVPRHPERGGAIAAAAAAAGLSVARRAKENQVPGDEAVYVADTLGEMGLWYRLCAAAFIGGTVAPMGGHNPYEPAALAMPIAAGPSRFNFEEAYGALERADACRHVSSVDDLVAFVSAMCDAAGGRAEAAVAAGARAAAALAPDPTPLEAAVAMARAWLDKP
jgi:3-deoxy-D-manno-octulosonic-acid transferase